MTKRNSDILREMYEAFNRGDISAALGVLDPSIEWRITPQAGPSPKTYHGHSGVRTAMSSLTEVWEDYRNEPIEFIDFGNCVVVRLRSSGRGRASGIDVEDEVAHLWVMRDGRAVRFEAYVDSKAAVESACKLEETGEPA